MSGSSAVWREVLAVYAIKTNTSKGNEQEVATLDDEKVELLKEIFWEMNTISSKIEDETRTEVTEILDEDGNVVDYDEKEVEVKVLKITVTHLSAEEMAAELGFTDGQLERMRLLLDDDFRPVWEHVLYGIDGGETALLVVAATQIGNVGSEAY